MEIIFLPEAEKDLRKINKSAAKSIQNRLFRILRSIIESPYEGFASPEQLKHEFTGYWSRELSKKDRVIYQVDEETDCVYIYSLLGHYYDK